MDATSVADDATGTDSKRAVSSSLSTLSGRSGRSGTVGVGREQMSGRWSAVRGTDMIQMSGTGQQSYLLTCLRCSRGMCRHCSAAGNCMEAGVVSEHQLLLPSGHSRSLGSSLPRTRVRRIPMQSQSSEVSLKPKPLTRAWSPL